MQQDTINFIFVKELFEASNVLLLNFSSYCTAISSLKEKYKLQIDEFHTTIDDDERKNIENLNNNIKYYIVYIFKKIKALKKEFKFIESEFIDFEKLYFKIRDSPIPLIEDVDKFIDYINSCLVNSSVSELFNNKLDEINRLYDGETNTKK